jgi:hypothetical protein
MKIEVSQDTFGFLVRLVAVSTEFGPVLQSFKDAIPAACRNYDGEKRVWRVARRVGDKLQMWLVEMGEQGAAFIDLNAQVQERVERAESGGDESRARLLLRTAHKALLIRPDAPPILAEAAYTVLKSQATSEQERAEYDAAIATIRAKGRIEDAA